MTRLTLKQLNYLLAIAETGNFRRAADHCGVSQPSLSAQLDLLESTLGLRLVERRRGGSRLTPPGREIANRARRVFAEIRGMEDFAAGAVSTLSGTLHLGVKASVGPYLMPHVVGELHRAYPELRLYIREDLAPELVEQLAVGLHDLALTESPSRHGDIDLEPLFDEPLLLVCAIDHPLAQAREVQHRDLRGQRVLSFSPRSPYHHRIGEFCEAVGADLRQDYESTSLDALRQMAGMGMGLCFLPALYADSEIRDRSDVVARPIAGRPLSRRIGLAWRRNAGHVNAIVRIAHVIRAICAERFPQLKVIERDTSQRLPDDAD